MDGVIALGGISLAGVLQWKGWDSARWPFANRLGGISLAAAGCFIAYATPLPSLYRQVMHTIFGTIGGMIDGQVPALAKALNSAGPWLVAVVLAVMWVAALLPDRAIKARMEWQMAWIGLFIPSTLTTAPGHIGGFLRGVFEVAGAVWSNSFAWLIGG